MTSGPFLPNFAAVLFIVLMSGFAYTVACQRYGMRAGLRFVPAIVLIAVFVGITHLFWPGAEWGACDDPRLRPLLKPFRFVDAFVQNVQVGRTARNWLADLTTSRTALNLHACIAIGAALALCVRKGAVALMVGVTMTCLIETSQLTGVFGLVACPWRQFDVDDLILNTFGVIVGFKIMRYAGIGPLTVSKLP